MSRIHGPSVGARRRQNVGFLSGPLPYGSLKRKIILWGIVPLAILLVLYVIVDDVVMPTVTRHGEEFTLPDVTEQDMVEARLTLDDLNLKYEVAAEEFSPGRPVGTIISQFPIGGTKVKEGRTIKFVISKGQKQVTIPYVAGLSVRQARLDIETAGLELGDIAWAFSDTLPEKVVVFSYPAGGTEVMIGSEVALMVNRGRSADFTYVLRVSGLTLSEALVRLDDKFLKPGVISYRLDDSYLPETVLEQSETEGTEVENGTEIDLVVSSTE